MVRRFAARLVRFAVAFVAAATLVMTSTSTQAQMMGMGQGMDMSISRRSLDAYTKLLSLDKDQKETLVTLYEGYHKDHEAAMEKMQADIRAMMEKAQDTGDFGAMQKEALRQSKKFIEKSRQLEDSFIADFKVVLNESQLANWSKVERHRRRDKNMRMAWVSGSTVDLTRVVDRVKAVPLDKAEFDSLLERYEMDMDKQLIAMEAVQKEIELKAFDTEANLMDMNRWVSIYKQPFETAKNMRETNREYARKLAMLLDEPSKERFEAEFKSRAFPRVYKPMHVVKMLETAEKFPDLDAAKKEEIAGIKAAFLRDAAVANEKWAKAVEEREDKGGGTMAVMMSSIGGGGGTELNKPVNEARQARKELEAKAKERLEALLTEDQKAKLPVAPRDNQNPFGDFMNNGEDE